MTPDQLDALVRTALAGDDNAAAALYQLCSEKAVAAEVLRTLNRAAMDFPREEIVHWRAAITELHPS